MSAHVNFHCAGNMLLKVTPNTLDGWFNFKQYLFWWQHIYTVNYKNNMFEIWQQVCFDACDFFTFIHITHSIIWSHYSTTNTFFENPKQFTPYLCLSDGLDCPRYQTPPTWGVQCLSTSAASVSECGKILFQIHSYWLVTKLYH